MLNKYVGLVRVFLFLPAQAVCDGSL
jgi:hypothetical protein